MTRRRAMDSIWNNNNLAWAGGILWLLLLPFPLGEGVIGTISRLLLLAILFYVPLLLPLVPPNEGRLLSPYQLIRQVHLFPLLPLLTSFFTPPGRLAALLASGWLLFTGLLALYGIQRLLPWQWPRAEELCISAGFLYLPVGAGWLVLSRHGITPLGFSEAIVLLTAIHFHYAAFAMPLLVGLTGRALARLNAPTWSTMLYRGVVGGVVAGPALIAAGITFSRPLEAAAATLFAVTLMAFALLTLIVIVPRLQQPATRLFLTLSSLILLFTMLLALGYALGGITGLLTLTIPQMVQLHGWGNALVVLFALAAWLRQRPGPLVEALPGIVLRPFEPRDQAAARRLIQEGLAERFGSLDEALNPDLANIQTTYIQQGDYFLVAESTKGIVGTGALLIHNAELGQMVRLSVHPTQRGQGLGRRLVEQLITLAQRRGLARLIVETNDDWDDALALYERCGFRVYKEEEGNIYMELWLK